jgi:ribosomal-protein-alanine acetyltransferase
MGDKAQAAAGTGWRIRSAGPEDYPRLEEIVRQSPEAAAWIPREDPPRAGSSTVVLVAGELARVAAFAAGHIVSDEAEILNVAVDPLERKQGVASQLVRSLIERLSAAGAKKIFLEVRESNRAAIRLYQKLGFHEAGRRRGYYRNPDEDALVYEKPKSELLNPASTKLPEVSS